MVTRIALHRFYLKSTVFFTKHGPFLFSTYHAKRKVIGHAAFGTNSFTLLPIKTSTTCILQGTLNENMLTKYRLSKQIDVQKIYVRTFVAMGHIACYKQLFLLQNNYEMYLPYGNKQMVVC